MAQGRVEHPVLFFDGDCPFCHATVRWVLKRDHTGMIQFAPLQGRTYGQLADPGKPIDLSTMVLGFEGRLWTRSAAAVRLLRAMGGGWPFLGALLWIVPRPLRDLGYRFVAHHRPRVPGEECMIPPAAQGRFLA